MTANNNGVVSDETIRRTATELALSVIMPGWEALNTFKAADVLAEFLSECGGDRGDFDIRVATLRQLLPKRTDTGRGLPARDLPYHVGKARELYQYIRDGEARR
jgi:hypothetical protein